MSKNGTRLKLEATEGHDECKAHKPLIEVLQSFDKRLGRMEKMLLVAAAAAIGSCGRDLILPLLVKLAGL